MAKGSNIVHQYFKKELEDGKILVKVNPLLFTGTEITVYREGEIELRDLEFDEGIFEDLAADEFEEVNPMEFNLYLSGLAK
jgi:hypothetical protein